MYCMSCACLVGDISNTLMTSENRKMSANWGRQSFQKRVGSAVYFEKKFNK